LHKASNATLAMYATQARKYVGLHCNKMQRMSEKNAANAADATYKMQG